MQLATYGFDDGDRAARIEGAMVVDLGRTAPLAALLGERLDHDGPRQPLDRARLRAPIPAPPAFLGVGLNYRDHAREVGREMVPTVFAKGQGAVAPPYGTLASPFASLDYEGELGLVIGRRAYRVSEAQAPDHIAGYVVLNDVTVRELNAPNTLVLGKGGPGHGPFGPWLTTADEVPDPHDLAINTHVNGELRQSSNTRELHRNCFEIVAWLSSALVLEPGTVIATGSPAGSGAGFIPPRWLVPGDIVRVEIERLGMIEHRVVPA